MVELDGPQAAAYLAAREGAAVQVTALGGGVSNHVLLVESALRRAVVKQSLGKLHVEQDWFSRRDRIWREAEAMRFLAPLLPAHSVPELLWEDRENFALAMSVARGDRTWKAALLAGEATEEQARALARMHRALLEASAGTAALSPLFFDLEVFDQLRLDPYYRATAARHPDLAPHFDAAIRRCQQNRRALVHGDWSPKNLMVDGDHLTAIDFEVIHYGDPAFDTAFLLNHLLLKSHYQPRYRALYRRLAEVYWRGLAADAELAAGTLQHLPLLQLARIDGKSPAEYIKDPGLKDQVRRFARDLLARRPNHVLEAFDRLP